MLNKLRKVACAVCAGLGAAFLITAISLQSQQPVIIINDIKEEK